MTKLGPFTLLARILLDGPSTAPQLGAALKGAGFDVPQTTAFVTLQLMEKQGLVTSAPEAPASSQGGRPRRLYELTAKGRRRAEADRKRIRKLFEV